MRLELLFRPAFHAFWRGRARASPDAVSSAWKIGPCDKVEKLLARVSKDFGKKGAPVKPEDMFMPWDDAKGKSKGYVYSSTHASYN